MPTLTGSISDFPSGARLDRPGQGAEGYALYGYKDGDIYVFAFQADAQAIGAGTTLWLDADKNRSTGYQIWGFTGGAEFNVDVGADGIPRLYTGDAGSAFVSNIDYMYSADGRVLQLAIPASLIGGAPEVRVFADVNNQVFLPNSYANIDIFVGGESAPPITVDGKVLDGRIGEWTAAMRLDTPATGTPGFALYGDKGETSFQFAITSETARIGAGTTIWLDTDTNRATGHQIFGFTGGAEYNVNFAADGTAALYRGGAGQTFVANIDYRLSPDGRVLELAIDKALLGGTERVRVYADVNDQVFIPNDYANVNLFVGAQVVTPAVDSPALRIGIVFSETTAANFYAETSYHQLIMSAQNQAIQAGIPFDLLSEQDLKNTASLANYDVLVFPGFSHVRSADLVEITESLAAAQRAYGIGFVAAGNFLTNTETGEPIAGDSYARMKTLLGVTLEGFGETAGIGIEARGGTNPILDSYGAGERVGNYTNISYLNFTDVTGNGTVLFDQVVSAPGGGTTRVDGVIATQTAGRNVHFASDAIIGNSNILQDAIGWIAADNQPSVSLAMTRGNSLFYSRNDMDQSQEAYDVIDTQPSIYDRMLPILERAYADFGFVGSYYVNIGADSPDQRTDWTVSRAYYDRLRAIDSEIGSHSYTHPHDTNLLLRDTPEILALIARVDPRNPNAVDPTTLTAAEKELLFSSYRFQFETSRAILEARLGYPITGAAVPGMPERIETTREIIKYYDYISGGYSGTGAGYPGAFGFLSPAEMNQVYLAPNMSFDFTLIGWLGLTPDQATARWLAEYETLTAHADTPIIAFPWHDYGLTNWDIGSPQQVYTEEMFLTIIRRAFADGTEFVTGADLANRIRSFQASALEATREGNMLSLRVNSTDAGRFALDVSDEGRIQSVANWYAWNESKVFLDRDGGQFNVVLGPNAADVTRVSDLPQRADLLSVTGNGTNLSFAFEGRGSAAVTLRTQGSDIVRITGTDEGTPEAGGRVVLKYNAAGRHDTAVTYVAAGTVVTATAAGDVLLGGTANDRLNGAGGADHLHGGAGNDTISGFAGVDRLFGGAGRDVLSGGQGNDQIFGGDGDDLILWTWGDGNDSIDGGAGTDRLQIDGTSAGQTMSATWNGTALSGLTNFAALTSVEEFQLNLQGGTNTLSYAAGSAGVTVNLTAGTASGFVSIANIANVNGGNGADVLTASDRANVLNGGAGDDRLIATVDNVRDTFDGGAGTDILDLSAYASNLTVNMSSSTVTIGGTGSNQGQSDIALNIETFVFGSGADSATGNASANRFVGGAGNDTLSGLGGNDTLEGGAGNDRLIGGAGTDVLIGGTGDDRFVFNSISDSSVSAPDVIMDFQGAGVTGGDVIDLSGMSLLPFLWMGSSNFIFGLGNQVRAFNNGTDTFVHINTNLDTSPEAVIRLAGVHNLSAGDFIL
ncbi:M10 family metallopeptidase C-terminal domain-containing protein [Paracoccus tibetensis]|uniref:Ca2+-binding protein, RTX toxin-related n=1 Tax=Paracoccus tibetensis TaxID=336292 RepID=A0A1G5DCM3_9RHOB|nr:M10 family metallopeptidase C-terminal domain-containing protein [Paracoccus tibetensis]SCY12366.1 Ca2+-binding protein, RTX toxin-related [Paracoccus tibetensis]